MTYIYLVSGDKFSIDRALTEEEIEKIFEEWNQFIYIKGTKKSAIVKKESIEAIKVIND